LNVQQCSAEATSEKSIKERKCFACGGEPSTGIGEHIIPKWLQNRCNLFDARITLINGTRIPYRSLTIPCCETCNNGFLAQIENDVQDIFASGTIGTYDQRLAVGRWMSKILIGILVKETSLALDRSNPMLGSIVPANLIDEFRHCHLVLQSARKPTSFHCLHGDLPFSLYYYLIADTAEADNFYLSTNVAGQCVAIRVGHLAVIFVSDGGLQMHVGPKGPFSLSGSTITQTQFRELAARVHYKSILRDATHFYLISESDEFMRIHQNDVVSYSGLIPNSLERRIFREWNDEEFSNLAADYTGVDKFFFFDAATNSPKTTLLKFENKTSKNSE